MKLKLKDAETEVGKSLKKIAHLEGRTDALERQIISQEHASSATLRSLAEEKKWRAHYKDQVSKIKSQTGQLQRRFETELRKKQVENSRLRERLLEPRRSSPGTISSVLSTRYNSYGSSPASRPATSDNGRNWLSSHDWPAVRN
jgi:exonuclease VII large subunit